jgi:gamma-glutamyltranspeptidase/glutathione hydrolase
MKTFLITIMLLAVMHQPTAGQHRAQNHSFVTRSEVVARHGMAATSQPLATQAAIDILKRGGTAVDAAIAANAVLGLVEPTGSGIGGDLFAIVWHADERRLYGLNASGRSPAALTLDEFRTRDLDFVPSLGPLSVSVPGAIDGWYTLHERFGHVPMPDLLAPAIQYATEGFPVTEVIAAQWAASAQGRAQYPGFSDIYLPNGRSPRKGEIFKNPALARTLRLIAENGRDAFYEGEIAKTIDAFMRKHGGFIRYDDLAAHSSDWVEPVSTDYRGYEVWELPPNGQGIAVLQMLNILEGYDIASMGFDSPEYLHLLVEAKKLAFEDRARFYGDPTFNKIPVEQLISKKYAAERRALINPSQAALTVSSGHPFAETGDTIYLTTADAAGNMVSLIQSNYSGHGSGMTPPTLGFCFQNRGALFTLTEDHVNTYLPRKRPFHTIIPAFVTKNDQPFMSFGVMGGAMQPQGHVQILVNMIDFGMNTQEAGDAHRLRHVGSSQPTGEKMNAGGSVYVEPGFSSETVASLRAKGHIVTITTGIYGGYQAIRRDEQKGVYFGASESRKDGHAAGF